MSHRPMFDATRIRSSRFSFLLLHAPHHHNPHVLPYALILFVSLFTPRVPSDLLPSRPLLSCSPFPPVPFPFPFLLVTSV